MTYQEAVDMVGENWVEWLMGLDSNLIPQVLENQIGFAVVLGWVRAKEAFEIIRETCS